MAKNKQDIIINNLKSHSGKINNIYLLHSVFFKPNCLSYVDIHSNLFNHTFVWSSVCVCVCVCV